MNKKGNLMMFPMKLILFFIAIVIMIALLNPIKTQVEDAQGNNALNCAGYEDADATATTNYTYNSSLPTYAMACTMVKLYPLWMVLGVMMIGIMMMIGGGGVQPPQYGYQQQY